MKRFLLLTMTLILALSTSAQVKKIAILETIDREGNVSYSVKLMVRSNLTKAISSTPGYEGYDRVNMSQIMGEQDFQRTGMVNEEQIKRLGEMCGADYIVVSEAAKVDASNIFVTATILNVETAQTIKTENALMATTASDIQHGCESLSNRLLGLPDNNQASSTSKTKTLAGRIFGSSDNSESTSKPRQEAAPQTVIDMTPTPAPSGTRSRVGDLKVFPNGTRGVVFYMDETGKGLAVSLAEDEMRWDDNRRPEDISSLENYDENDHEFIYGLGRSNTAKIRQSLGNDATAANWCVEQGEGWYLPSAGELHYLMANSKKGTLLHNKLEAAGGALDGWYWSSTEHDKKEAMNISDSGSVFTESKKTDVKVRAIIAFSE